MSEERDWQKVRSLENAFHPLLLKLDAIGPRNGKFSAVVLLGGKVVVDFDYMIDRWLIHGIGTEDELVQWINSSAGTDAVRV